MEKEKLHKSLKDLHEEVKNVEAGDEKSKDLLDTLATSIQRVIDNPEETTAEHQANLLENLKESVRYFEVSHPALTAIMNNIINTLKGIGA